MVFRHNFSGERHKINCNVESPSRIRHPETKTESERQHDHDCSIWLSCAGTESNSCAGFLIWLFLVDMAVPMPYLGFSVVSTVGRSGQQFGLGE